MKKMIQTLKDHGFSDQAIDHIIRNNNVMNSEWKSNVFWLGEVPPCTNVKI